MSETKKCKYCQSEIDKKARVCPNCRKKQGGGVLKFIITGIVIIALVGFIASLNEPKQVANTNDTSNQQNADNPANDTNTKATANLEETDASDSSEAKDDLIALGSEGQSDDLILKVNEVGDTDEIKENDFLSYKPDSGKFAIVNITIKNSGKQAVSLTNGYFKLLTADGTEYTPTILIGLDNKYISFETINPGLDVTGNLVFEVPADLKVADTTLQFSGTGLFTASTNFSLK